MRGWIFQGLCLSPRIIHLGAQEVIWQCRSTHERESRPNIREHVSSWVVYFPDFSHTTVPELRREWHTTVAAYSWRALTFSKDRLPAIAAMATRMQECRPTDRYLAGLWQSSLCFDLLWCNSDRTTSIYDPATIIAQRIDGYLSPTRIGVPSWSWASTPRSVWWREDATFEMLSNAEVLDIAYAIRGPEVSGEILNAAITLRAPLISLQGIRHADKTMTCVNQNSQLSQALNESQAVTAEHLLYDNFHWDTDGTGEDYPALQQLFLLVVLAERNPFCPFVSGGIVFGQTQQTNTFCRVGFAKFELVDCWLEILAWERERGNACEYPLDRYHSYRKTPVSMLENTPTQVITLV